MVRHLLVLNGLAVLGSVAYHASAWGFTSLFWWTDRYQRVAVPDFSQLGTPSYYALRILEQTITFSLPAFLFVSGFFVAFAAGRTQPTFGWNKVGARIRMLVIPYLLWSLVIFVGRGLEGTTDTSAGYLGQLLFGQAAEPFYYVPLIAQLYLLSPFLVRLLERHSKAVLLAAALVQLTVQFARYPVALGWDVPAATWAARHLPGWFFPHMVFWFVFGTFTGFHLSSLRQWLSRWKSMLPWVTAALGLAGLLEWEVLLRLSGKEWLPPTLTVVDSLYACGCVLTYVAFSQTANWISRPLDLVGQRSYGVYLIHAPVLELFSRASYHMAPLLLSHQFVFQPLLIVAGVGVPLLLMMTVDRSRVRPCYSYLFG